VRSAARNAVRISSPISRGPFCPVPLLISSFRGREAGNIVIARDDNGDASNVLARGGQHFAGNREDALALLHRLQRHSRKAIPL
jgi:hypothetical protein